MPNRFLQNPRKSASLPCPFKSFENPCCAWRKKSKDRAVRKLLFCNVPAFYTLFFGGIYKITNPWWPALVIPYYHVLLLLMKSVRCLNMSYKDICNVYIFNYIFNYKIYMSVGYRVTSVVNSKLFIYISDPSPIFIILHHSDSNRKTLKSKKIY